MLDLATAHLDIRLSEILHLPPMYSQMIFFLLLAFKMFETKRCILHFKLRFMGHCEWVVLYSYLGSACSQQRAAACTRSIPHYQKYDLREKAPPPPQDIHNIETVLLHEVQVGYLDVFRSLGQSQPLLLFTRVDRVRVGVTHPLQKANDKFWHQKCAKVAIRAVFNWKELLLMKIGSQTRKVVKMEKKVNKKRLEACRLCQCSGCTSKIMVSCTLHMQEKIGS